MSVNCVTLSKILDPFLGWPLLDSAAVKGIMTAILIVEDDVLANEHLEFILQEAGYEVLSATSADEAAELLEDHEDVSIDRHRYQPAGYNERPEARCGGEGATTQDEYYHRDGLQCTYEGGNSARKSVYSKTVQCPEDDRGSSAFPVVA